MPVGVASLATGRFCVEAVWSSRQAVSDRSTVDMINKVILVIVMFGVIGYMSVNGAPKTWAVKR